MLYIKYIVEYIVLSVIVILHLLGVRRKILHLSETEGRSPFSLILIVTDNFEIKKKWFILP